MGGNPRPLRRAAIALLTAAVMTISLWASTASAGDVGIVTIGFPTVPQLTITPSSRPGHQVVSVTGIQRTSASPQYLTGRGYKIELRLWGNDDASLGNGDDQLAGPYAPRDLTPGPEGVQYTLALRVSNSLLDEDVGADELYVGYRLVNPQGKVIRKIESNHVSGRF